MVPITDADKPRSWPSTGTTKVWTSQQDDSSQFTISRRRNIGSRTRFHAAPWWAPAARMTGGNSLVTRIQSQPTSGKAASTRNAARKPPWSMIRPAANGPMKLDTAGPIASHENTCLSWVGFSAARPTCRCRAMDAAPVAPPVSSALTQSTGNTGHTTARPAPRVAAMMEMPIGRLSPWRSAKRPAGSARNTWVSAKSASSTPTAASL